MIHDQGGKTTKDDYGTIEIHDTVHALRSSVTGEIKSSRPIYTSLDNVGTCGSTSDEYAGDRNDSLRVCVSRVHIYIGWIVEANSSPSSLHFVCP